MLKTLLNAWKVPDLRKRILFTLMILFIYRVGTHVPIPGINSDFVAKTIEGSTLFSGLDILVGGALTSLTVFALGILPYINSSIIMNLLPMAIPALERMVKEGPEGRKKIASITRYLTVVLGLFMASGIVLSLGDEALIDPTVFNKITVVMCLTAGTAFIMWLGEKINEQGIGNGISLIIFISIVSRLPQMVALMFQGTFINSPSTMSMGTFFGIFGVLLLVMLGITFVDLGERRIPVQYAKRVVGRKMYGGQSTYIPMKINQSGVLPLIFAMTLMQFPALLIEFFTQETDAIAIFYSKFLAAGTGTYAVIYALLIFFFTFFYTQISFNPIDVSKNIQQNGGFILGIRPGKPTSDYLSKILSKVTLFGALFLALIAAVPTLMKSLSDVAGGIFGATSLLIMVNVSLETTKQIESQLLMRHYKGFLK
ncbi:MAG: preprotein translocase subunit SecY [Eubacteriales bacterium]